MSQGGVPEFDNFYLDMNGIVHTVARLIISSGTSYTETDIFVAVWEYVEALFSSIRPRKVLFLAIDGVAPRAKINQQRSRRYRSSHEAKVAAEEALKKAAKNAKKLTRFVCDGENLSVNGSNLVKVAPPTDHTCQFDTNCITPGTEFMTRLSQHMEFLIAKTITESPEWQDLMREDSDGAGLQIIFSGAEVPGEGEHKIMEFIRLNKAKPGYNPNTRHCVYGLDADLILLGLLSHDPHFCLLREEVQFGRANNSKPETSSKKIKKADDTKFYLLHLSLMRDYLSLEFDPLIVPLERAIDDFIMMMLLVGNDFLPGLPNMHLGEGVLDTIFAAYKKIITKNNGTFLNENGRICFGLLARLLDELAVKIEEPAVCELIPGLVGFSDLSIESDISDYSDTDDVSIEISQNDTEDVIEILQDVMIIMLEDEYETEWISPKGLNAIQVKSLHDVAFVFRFLFSLDVNTATVILKKSPDYDSVDSDWFASALLNLKKRIKNGLKSKDYGSLKMACDDYKREYYMDKLHFDPKNDPKCFKNLVDSFCEGLHWNMLYYYEGVPSWTWFYPFHYAPQISDLADYCRSYTPQSFILGSPLTPIEQLMSVLPPASNSLVPQPLRSLMLDPTSPVKDFYPEKYATDANGKKQSWEAIVLIPFIDADVLRQELSKKSSLLSKVEHDRNTFGESKKYELCDPITLRSPSSTLSDLESCIARQIVYNLPVLEPSERFIAALCKGVQLGANCMLGFPSLGTLPVPFSAELTSAIGLDVFGQPARGLSMQLKLLENTADFSSVGFEKSHEKIKGKKRELTKVSDGRHRILQTSRLAHGVDSTTDVMFEDPATNTNFPPDLLGLLKKKRVYVDWPYLREGILSYITDSLCRYTKSTNGVEELAADPLDLDESETQTDLLRKIEREMRKRGAVEIGKTSLIAWVKPFTGMAMSADGNMIKTYETLARPFPLQLVVPRRTDSRGRDLIDPRMNESENGNNLAALAKIFPTGHPAILIVPGPRYGCLVRIKSFSSPTIIDGVKSKNIEINVSVEKSHSPLQDTDIKSILTQNTWISSQTITREVGISFLLLSKITSSMTMFLGGEMVRASNIGLGVKSDAKGLVARGLARRTSNSNGLFSWEFGPKVVRCLMLLKERFPNLFKALEEQKSAGNINAETIFDDPMMTKLTLMEKVEPIQRLVYETIGQNLKMVSYEGDHLGLETFSDLLKTVKMVTESAKKHSEKDPIVIKGSFATLLSMSTGTMRLMQHKQRFSLGDRVICACKNSELFGSIGYVVGIEYENHMDNFSKKMIKQLYLFIPSLLESNEIADDQDNIEIFDIAECINLTDPQPLPGTSPVSKNPQGRKPSVEKAPTVTEPAWKTPIRDLQGIDMTKKSKSVNKTESLKLGTHISVKDIFGGNYDLKSKPASVDENQKKLSIIEHLNQSVSNLTIIDPSGTKLGDSKFVFDKVSSNSKKSSVKIKTNGNNHLEERKRTTTTNSIKDSSTKSSINKEKTKIISVKKRLETENKEETDVKEEEKINPRHISVGEPKGGKMKISEMSTNGTATYVRSALVSGKNEMTQKEQFESLINENQLGLPKSFGENQNVVSLTSTEIPNDSKITAKKGGRVLIKVKFAKSSNRHEE